MEKPRKEKENLRTKRKIFFFIPTDSLILEFLTPCLTMLISNARHYRFQSSSRTSTNRIPLFVAFQTFDPIFKIFTVLQELSRLILADNLFMTIMVSSTFSFPNLIPLFPFNICGFQRRTLIVIYPVAVSSLKLYQEIDREFGQILRIEQVGAPL